MKKVDMLHAYFYHQSAFLKADIDQLQENIRYRNISDVDCLELIIAKARYDMLMQVYTDVASIFDFKGITISISRKK